MYISMDDVDFGALEGENPQISQMIFVETTEKPKTVDDREHGKAGRWLVFKCL